MVELDEDELEDQPPMTLMPVFTGERFRRLVNYEVMVETWDHKNYGRGKRGWLSKFTEAERKKIGSYYARFYKWYFVSGTPRRVMMRLDTLQLLQRAVNFFATI